MRKLTDKLVDYMLEHGELPDHVRIPDARLLLADTLEAMRTSLGEGDFYGVMENIEFCQEVAARMVRREPARPRAPNQRPTPTRPTKKLIADYAFSHPTLDLPGVAYVFGTTQGRVSDSNRLRVEGEI